MLSKLTRYEFQAVLRLILPISLVMCAVTLISFITFSLPLTQGILILIPNLMSILYIVSIVGLMAVTVFLAIIRFYKNLVTKEGYLMFTLPVKVEHLIFSKLIVAFITTTYSIVLSILSLIIVSRASHTPFNLPTLSELFDEILAVSNVSVPVFILTVIVLYIVTLAGSYLTYYASIAVGQTLSNNKLLGSFVGYIIINFIYQIIGTLLVLVIYLQFKEIAFIECMVIILPFTCINTVVFFFVTRHFLNTKLNLE